MTAEVRGVFFGLFVALAVATAAGQALLRRWPASGAVRNLNSRVNAWWVMIVTGGVAMWLGHWVIVALFAALAWFALGEFSARDWAFAVVPVQFAFVALGWNWPALLLIPALGLIMRRVDVLLCVYGLSLIPALPRAEQMLYFVLVVQASDVLQYLWGRAAGRTKIAPVLSPAKTVEGFVGGVLSATALGTAIHYLIPAPPWQAAVASVAITVAGFLSGLVFSALKRQRGVKDWGTAIAGHGGVLDRVDSLCLSAPLFYLMARWCFA